MNQNDEYEFLDRVFLRSPFYSPDDYAPEQLKQVLLRPDFRNALWLASPDFYRVVEKQAFDWERLGRNERLSLLKYYNRMSFRATPFGAFSAFSLIPWDDSDQSRLVEAGRSVLHLLPSREWQHHEEKRAQKEREDFYILRNPTLMRISDSLSFVRSTGDQSGKITFSVNAVAAGKLNLRLVAMVKGIPMLKSAVLAKITDWTGCTLEEAREYFYFLLDQQFFLTEFEGCLIGQAPGRTGNAAWNPLKNLGFTDKLDLAKNWPIEEDELPGSYQGNRCYAGLERAVQQGGLAVTWREELLAAIGLLRKIVIPYPTPALKDFSAAFKARFEDRKIGLLTALDPDTGIGYGNLYGNPIESALLQGITFPDRTPAGHSIEWTPVHSLFFRLWQQNADRSIYDPLVIDPDDLAGLESPADLARMPASLALLFSRTNGKLVLDNNGGATATALLGRFTLFSAETECLCREIVEAETRANPDVIFAELHQLSDTHVDNINRRQPLYDHVIPINTFHAGSGQKVIALNDLVISIKGNEVILESVSLRKRVVPRLPTAYNYHHNQLAIFRMLGDLQFQGLHANLSFDLKRLFPGLSFYPRVEFRKTIISVAKWLLSEKEIKGLTAGKTSISQLHIFREERGIPRQVTMGISDQQMVFDLSSDQQALFFLECLKGAGSAVIREYPDPDRSVLAGKNKLAAQFITVLTRKGRIYNGAPVLNSSKQKQVQREFIPGSEWLYLKLYCTEEAADKILLKVIRPFLSARRNVIKSWFFIRYHDPGSHIRLRLWTGLNDPGMVLTDFRKHLWQSVHALLIRDIVQDTYLRELERYGEDLIEDTEQCFYAGSELTLSWLRVKQGQSTPGMDMAIFDLVYRMAGVFISSNPAMADFFKWRSEHFIREFGSKKEFRVELDRKYRMIYTSLTNVIEGKIGGGTIATNRPAKKLLNSIDLLAQKCVNAQPPVRLNLLSDLIHMQINRLFNHKQRQHEALIYFCLAKYTASVMARQVKN